jgi:hypothetical protein
MEQIRENSSARAAMGRAEVVRPMGAPLVAPRAGNDDDRGAERMFVRRTRCPVCDSGRLATLIELPYDSPQVRGHIESHYRNQGIVDHAVLRGVDYALEECRDCDLIFQRMVPTEAMLAVLYDGFIDPRKLKAHELSRLTLANFQDVARRLTDLLLVVGKEPKDVSLLDFGFGYGRWARVAVGMGMRVFATEISPEKIAFARSLGVTVLSEDELPNYAFDIVHAEQVFEHLTEPGRTFDLLSPCVADGGVFKIAVPRQGRVRTLLRRHGLIDWSPFEYEFRRRGYNDYNAVLPLEHLNAFSRKAIEHLARRAGMTVRPGSFGGRHLDLDVGSVRDLARSAGQLGVRVLKDLYVRLGPGARDGGYYLLQRSP